MTAGTPGLRMPAFSRGDLGERGAQLVGMIHGDRRDDAERGARDDVGGVEPAAEADLQDQRIGWVFGEGRGSRRGGDLEERDGRRRR